MTQELASQTQVDDNDAAWSNLQPTTAPDQTPAEPSDSIAHNYDRHLGPVLFDFSAADMAARVAAARPEATRVLEVACGTGIATEHLWRALGPATEIVATDLSPQMLDYAIEHRGALANVTFRQASADQLPFDDASFDVLVCQFGIMFFPDKDAALAEFARVLRPGGLLAFTVWDSHDQNRVAEIAHQTITSFFDSDPPDFLTVPFGYHEIETIAGLIFRAGFEDASAHTVQAVIESDDAKSVAQGFVKGNPGILEIRERGTADPEEIVDALAAKYETAFAPAPMAMRLQEITLLATKP